MKPRLHIGWVLFAFVMVWAECSGDLPRLFFPNRTTPDHYFTSLTNVIAVIGLTLYAFNLRKTRAFWRIYAPAYAIFIAVQFGIWLPRFVEGSLRVMSYPGTSYLTGAGMVALTFPLLAMTTYSIIALLRLGDWIGPTRRAFRERNLQLSLPL